MKREIFAQAFYVDREVAGFADSVAFAVQQVVIFEIALVDESFVGFVGTESFGPWDYYDDFPNSNFAISGIAGSSCQPDFVMIAWISIDAPQAGQDCSVPVLTCPHQPHVYVRETCIAGAAGFGCSCGTRRAADGCCAGADF